MSQSTTPATTRSSTRKRYKRLAYSSLAVGIAALLVGTWTDRFVIGVLCYWAGFFGMFAVWWRSPVALYDERDTTIERKASQYTLNVFAVVFVLGAPGGLALEESGVVQLPAAFAGSMWTLFWIYVVFSVFMIYLGRRT